MSKDISDLVNKLKIVKLKKTWLRDPIVLLKKLGLVTGNESYPERVFISKKDMKTLKRNVTKKFRQVYPHIPMKTLAFDISWYMCNYSPSEFLEDVITPGYVLVLPLDLTSETVLGQLVYE